MLFLLLPRRRTSMYFDDTGHASEPKCPAEGRLEPRLYDDEARRRKFHGPVRRFI